MTPHEAADRFYEAEESANEKIELNSEETKAISTLHRLAKRWPSTLWLYSANGTLCVMRTGPDGEHIMLDNGGADPDFIVDYIDIQNDGGDW